MIIIFRIPKSIKSSISIKGEITVLFSKKKNVIL